MRVAVLTEINSDDDIVTVSIALISANENQNEDDFKAIDEKRDLRKHPKKYCKEYQTR